MTRHSPLRDQDFESCFEGEPPPRDPLEDLARGRARARRRRALVAGSLLSLAVAGVPGALLLQRQDTVVLGVPAESSKYPSPVATPGDGAPTQGSSASVAALTCGGRFEGPAASPISLVGRFPSTVDRREPVVSGTVEVVNSQESVSAVVIPSAEVLLVKNGRIVTLPMPQDLVGQPVTVAPGRSATLPAAGTLTPCEAPDPSAASRVPPGSYEVYARVVLNRDDGSQVVAAGGPWSVEVV